MEDWRNDIQSFHDSLQIVTLLSICCVLQTSHLFSMFNLSAVPEIGLGDKLTFILMFRIENYMRYLYAQTIL